jgi:hypothetical protein
MNSYSMVSSSQTKTITAKAAKQLRHLINRTKLNSHNRDAINVFSKVLHSAEVCLWLNKSDFYETAEVIVRSSV